MELLQEGAGKGEGGGRRKNREWQGYLLAEVQAALAKGPSFELFYTLSSAVVLQRPLQVARPRSVLARTWCGARAQLSVDCANVQCTRCMQVVAPTQRRGGLCEVVLKRCRACCMACTSLVNPMHLPAEVVSPVLASINKARP